MLEALTPPTREAQLRDAIEEARIPPRDYRVYRALFHRATYNSAVIEPRFQPKSIKRIASDTNCSEATVKRALAHLESHGWITRVRRETPGRGYRTNYVLLIGTDCDCTPERPEAKSDAERARLYRARKKLRTESTEPAHTLVTDEPAQIPVTESSSNCRDEVARIDVTKRLASRDEPAGQTAFSGKSVRWRGEGKSVALQTCATCKLPMYPLGYRSHPCCDPDEVDERWAPPTIAEIVRQCLEGERLPMEVSPSTSPMEPSLPVRGSEHGSRSASSPMFSTSDQRQAVPELRHSRWPSLPSPRRWRPAGPGQGPRASAVRRRLSCHGPDLRRVRARLPRDDPLRRA